MSSLPAFILTIVALMLTLLLWGPAGEALADAGERWQYWWWTRRADTADRRQRRRHRRAASAYRWQAERAQQQFHREFDEEVEREQHGGPLGDGVDHDFVRREEEKKRYHAMLHVIRQRTSGCCDTILTARTTVGPALQIDPAHHSLSQEAQLRVFHYLDRFIEESYASTLIHEDAEVVKGVLVAEGARQVCRHCPLRDKAVAKPDIPCKTVAAFGGWLRHQDFADHADA